MKINKVKMLLDIAMTVSFMALMEPKMTGMSLHEWGGLAIGLLFAFHLILNWKWIVAVTGGFFRKMPVRTRINFLLNCLLFAGFTLIIISGMAIAKTIDFSWLSFSRSFPWKAVHVSSALMILLAVGAHIGLHGNWILQRIAAKKELRYA